MAGRIIDFHTHLDRRWFDRPLPSEAAFLEGMDRCGVEVSCIFTLMGFHEPCAPHNDALAERAARHPRRLVPFATVDPRQGEAAVRELERCAANPSFRGIKFHSWLQAFAPSMVRETMVAILRFAARQAWPVLFHDGTPPYATTFQIAALARAVREATVVLGHAGLADHVYQAGQLMRELPNLHACICSPKAGDVAYLAQAGGAERLLFGSDFGFSDWRLIAERVDDIAHAGLDEAAQARICRGNAERLLRLRERPLA